MSDFCVRAMGRSVLQSVEWLLVPFRELAHSFLPAVAGSAPFVGDVAYSQPDQLHGGIVVGEVPPRLDDLSQLCVDTFDGVGGVDHPPDGWGKAKNGITRSHARRQPVKRLSCLGTRIGWKFSRRSRGTSS